MALFVQLDVNYPENHKIIEAGLDGTGLHAMALCVARRMEGDGWLSRAVLRRLGASDGLIDRLVDLRLFEVGEGGLLRPWGWLDRNPSQGAIAAMVATKRDSAKAGNHKRWGHDGSVSDCPTCNPSAQVVAECDSDGSHPESQCDPLGSPESESESEKTHTVTEPVPKLTPVPGSPSSADADGPADRFGDFWKLVPRKAARQDASKAWAKATRGRTGADPDLIIARWRTQLQVWAEERRPIDKHPHAATWLNGRRWEDDDLTRRPDDDDGDDLMRVRL